MGYDSIMALMKKSDKCKAEDINVIDNLASGKFDVPYIIDETMMLLDDSYQLYNMIPDVNKIALCKMIKRYTDNCLKLFMEGENKLAELCKYGKLIDYRVVTAEGERKATEKEVEAGVEQLIGKEVYPVGEEIYKKLCLLTWTIEGNIKWYKLAGYTVEYSNNDVKTTFLEMIMQSANELNEAMKWCGTDEYNKAERILNKTKKKKGIGLLGYAKDEIKEDISVNQLTRNIVKIFPRSSSNKDYRKALALALKATKNNVRLHPLEITYLRKQYKAYALDKSYRDNERHENESNKNEELEAKCEELLRERYKGVVDSNDFAFKIIETVKKSGYTRI